MYYFEWAQRPSHRKGLMVPEQGLATLYKTYNPGYRSVYLFDADAANAIKLNGHSRGLTGFSVTARGLYLDIDTKDPKALSQVEGALRDGRYTYSIWDSGGKGYHFYIPHEEITDINLPYSHSLVAKRLAGEWADMSLYRNDRLISIEGNIHPSTKNKKILIKTAAGDNVLTVPIVTRPAVAPIQFHSEPMSDAEMLGAALSRCARLLESPPKPGSRHIRIWGTARDLALSGIAFETALDLLTQVNNSWPDPKGLIELERAVRQAYQIND